MARVHAAVEGALERRKRSAQQGEDKGWDELMRKRDSARIDGFGGGDERRKVARSKIQAAKDRLDGEQ